MSGLELNKLAAAILFAGLMAMVAGNVADILYAPSLHHAEEKRGYQIEVVETHESSAAVAEEEKPVDVAEVMKLASRENGEKIFKKCAMCHATDNSGQNKIGPNLWNVVGGDRGKKAGYAYSSDLAAMTGKWTYEELFHFLKNPKKYAKGTKMSFVGLKKPEEIADVVEYLRQHADNPQPLP